MLVLKRGTVVLAPHVPASHLIGDAEAQVFSKDFGVDDQRRPARPLPQTRAVTT